MQSTKQPTKHTKQCVHNLALYGKHSCLAENKNVTGQSKGQTQTQNRRFQNLPLNLASNMLQACVLPCHHLLASSLHITKYILIHFF